MKNDTTKIFRTGMTKTIGNWDKAVRQMIEEDESEGSVHKAFMSWQLQLPTVIFFGLAALFGFNNDWLIVSSISTVICFLFALMFIIFHGVTVLKLAWKWFINLPIA